MIVKCGLKFLVLHFLALGDVKDESCDGIVLPGKILVHFREFVVCDGLVLWNDFVLATEVNAFLGLFDPSNGTSRDGVASKYERKLRHL